MFEKVGVPIKSIVENMASHLLDCGHVGHIFGEGGAQKMCKDYGVPFSRRAAARHPHPRTGGLGAADGRRDPDGKVRRSTGQSRRKVAISVAEKAADSPLNFRASSFRIRDPKRPPVPASSAR